VPIGTFILSFLINDAKIACMEHCNSLPNLFMDDFDKKIGRRLKELRLQNGSSQQAIGDLLGVSFQQTQKYETGANRVSAKTLYILKSFYNVELEDFFNTIEAPLPLTKLENRPKHSINDAFYKIDSKEVRKAIHELITEVLRSSEEVRDE
jgi:transcriptional regulator with XRE-family HTH domain